MYRPRCVGASSAFLADLGATDSVNELAMVTVRSLMLHVRHTSAESSRDFQVSNSSDCLSR